MQKKLNQLICKYEKHCRHGEDNLQRLKVLGDTSSKEYIKQTDMNSIWRILLKDLYWLPDKRLNDNKESN